MERISTAIILFCLIVFVPHTWVKVLILIPATYALITGYMKMRKE